MLLPPATRWRLGDPGLITRHFEGEDEWVVFSPLSGEVHVLNAAAHALLLALRDLRTADDLVEHLAGCAGRRPDDELRRAVAAAMTSLDDAGLIEPQVP